MDGVHRYPQKQIAQDYARGGVGLALTALPIVFLALHPMFFWPLLAGAVLFAIYTGRTLLRQLTVFHSGEQGIAAHGPLASAIAWRDLADLRLRYFSTRRDRKDGWMQLTLRGGGRTIRLESPLIGFSDIADRAADAARANGLSLNDATTNNLVALGIDNPPPDDETGEAADERTAGREDWVSYARRQQRAREGHDE